MKELLHALKSLKGTVLILTHHNADVDAVASTLALKALLKELGVEADIGAAESLSRPSHKLAEGWKFLLDPDCAKYDNVILVETSVPEQLASVKSVRADIIIDHHPAGKLADGVAVKWIDETSKSCSQMIFRLFRELGIVPDKAVALALAAGLTADTAHLRLAEVKEFEDLALLLKSGIAFADVLHVLETPVDMSERIAVLKAVRRLDAWRIGGMLFVASRVASHEAAACRAMVKMGADVAVVVAEKENEVRISSRGRDWILEKGIDLSVIFKEVGAVVKGSGGGHNLAGSANGSDKKAVDAAVKYVRRELEKAMGEQAKKID